MKEWIVKNTTWTFWLALVIDLRWLTGIFSGYSLKEATIVAAIGLPLICFFAAASALMGKIAQVASGNRARLKGWAQTLWTVRAMRGFYFGALLHYLVVLMVLRDVESFLLVSLHIEFWMASEIHRWIRSDAS